MLSIIVYPPSVGSGQEHSSEHAKFDSMQYKMEQKIKILHFLDSLNADINAQIMLNMDTLYSIKKNKKNKINFKNNTTFAKGITHKDSITILKKNSPIDNKPIIKPNTRKNIIHKISSFFKNIFKH